MTVISALKLDSENAILVADEQVSFGGRKADLVTKVTQFDLADNFKAIIAGAGSANLFDAAIQLLQGNLKKIPDSTFDFACSLSHHLVHVRHRTIDGYTKGQLGLSEIELQSGFRVVNGERLPISPDIIQGYHKILHDPDIEVSALVLASMDGKIDLFTSFNTSTDVSCSSQPFRVIGSGADSAHMEFTKFFESRPREKRLTIERSEGLAAILNATNLATIRNIGVGGTPNIYIFNHRQIINPSEASSHLAVEIVRATNAGYISKDFQAEALVHLLYDLRPFEEVESEMLNKVPNDSHLKFSRFLRGYKTN